MGNAVEALAVGKRYLLGEDVDRRSWRAALAGLTGRPGGRDVLWSLREVSFEVAEGESLGIIGRNGAGKTTMLRLLGRITEPTEGLVRTRGRVGSLLEVGTGFHPQLTGRENVYLNGAVLGLRRRDIDRRFDEIVAFAGVERFLDTPIKRYSSGMQLRLAFAVAAHVDTDVLLVDEVLAVGDAEFQRRCLTKVRSVGEEGRTVVFVSHDLDAVAALCPRAVWLDGGRVAAVGRSSEVIDRYLGSGEAHRGRRELAAGRDGVRVEAVAVLDDTGAPSDAPRRDRPFTLEVAFSLAERTPGFDLAVSISGRSGTRLLEEALSSRGDGPRPEGPGRYRARLVVPPVLRAGRYTVNVWAGSAYDDDLVWEQDVLAFRLEGNPGDRSDRVLDLGLPFEVESSPSPPAR